MLLQTKKSESPPDDGAQQRLTAVLGVIDRARHRIALYASVLPPLPFATVAVGRALTQFAVAHGQHRVQLLIDDADQALRDNERLVALTRRLPEQMQWRQLAAEDRQAPDCVIVNDNATGVRLVPALGNSMEWIDAAAAREWYARFDRLWQRAAPLPALHSLGLSP